LAGYAAATASNVISVSFESIAVTPRLAIVGRVLTVALHTRRGTVHRQVLGQVVVEVGSFRMMIAPLFTVGTG